MAATVVASLSCGASNPQGFAPSEPADAGPDAYPSFGSSTPAEWSGTFGGTAVTPYAVSAAADGTVRVAGALRGLATIGPVTLNSGGGSDALVAKLDGGGQVLWAHNYGDTADQSANAAAVDANGDVLVTGTFAGILDFTGNEAVIQSLPVSTSTSAGPAAAAGGAGTSRLQARGATDAFVARLDSSGHLRWALQFGAARATVSAKAIALGPDGAAVITGSYEGPLGNGTPTPAGGSDVFVTKIDATGTTQWVRTFGGSGMDGGTALAVDPRGEVLLTGNYEGSIDLGTGPLDGFGMEDVFVAKLSASGETEWAKGFGGPLNDDAVAVAFDPSGNAITAANYAGTVDLGTGPISTFAPPGGNPVGNPGWDVFVAQYDLRGVARWAHHYGSADVVDKADAMFVDATGNVTVAGHLRSSFPFGRCALTPANPIFGNAFVGVIDPGGNAVCAVEYGNGPLTRIRSLSGATLGRVVAVGDFVGGADFGQGRLEGQVDTGFAIQEPTIPAPLQ